MSPRAQRLLVATLAAAFLTFPFIWLELDQIGSTGGDVTLRFSATRGLRFFLGLAPLAFIAGLIWLLWALQRAAGPLLTGLDPWSQHMRALTRRPAFYPLLMALCLTLPFLSSDKLSVNLAQMGLYMILALGLNITVGMAGLLVLGYVGFYAVGAYTFAILNDQYPWITWWMALPVACLLGGLVGFAVGLPCLRLRGDYLALVTLGFAEAFRELLRAGALYEWTHSDQGIRVPFKARIGALFPTGTSETGRTEYLLGREQAGLLMVLLLLFLVIFVIHRTYHSRIGRAWIAIREDEVAAAAMGINVVRTKLLAFVLSAAIASVAGVLYVARTGFVDPSICHFMESAQILAMVILGGLGSIPGVILGAALLFLIPTVLRDYVADWSATAITALAGDRLGDLNTLLPPFADYRFLFFGGAMVAMMLFRPQGLIGSRRHQHELTGE